MLSRRYRVVWMAILLPVLLLACSLGSKKPSSGAKVPVSQEAADRLEQKLSQSVGQEGDGTFDLEITDAELTSYVALNLVRRIDKPEDMPLEDFQVQFTGDQMVFSGYLTTVCPLRLNVKVAASAAVEDGQLGISVDKARLGVLPIPKALLKNLSRVINETIVEAPERMERAVEITDIVIGEGVMHISGRMTETHE